MQLFTRNLSADCDTPLSAFARLCGDDNGVLNDCFLLESAEGGENWGRYSFIGFEPACIAREEGGKLWLRKRGELEDIPTTGDMQAWLRANVLQAEPLENELNLPFTGGAVGYFSFEMAHKFENIRSHHDGSQWSCSACLLVDRFVIFDNLRGSMFVCVRDDDEIAAEQVLDAIQNKLEQKDRSLRPLRLDACLDDIPAMHPHIAQDDYEKMVSKAREYIVAGDIFQVVLSQRFSAPLQGDPLAIYRAVRQINPSPYLFFINITDTTLIGSSPEVLVRQQGKQAIVRPIAGTRPRGKTEVEDNDLAAELLADAKELAEHVMLLDLGRNDLGRVCDFGSVQVTERMMIERYSHVMHIVSQVEGRLRYDADALDLLAATFPAGTVSGAPKVRALQIIDELEPEARGPYAGALGYFAFGGESMNTAITIRTAMIKNGRVNVQAGAGIVADSIPANEHQECVNKAMAMFRAVALAMAQEK
ncbi:MAG: anthranilate synthase component I [Mariprofundales bacterium]